MARFLIRNNRPRRMLRIDGQVLRARNPYLNRTPGEMWVGEDRFVSRQVTNLLRLKRLVVVDVEGVDLGDLEAYLRTYVFADEISLSPEKGLEILGLSAPEDDQQVDASADIQEEIVPEPEPVEPEETTPEVVEPEPELVPEPDASLAVEDPIPDPLPEVAEPPPAPEEPLDDPTGPDTLEELKALSYRDLQGLAGDLGLAANGKKAALIKRIHAYQHGDS